MASNLEPLASLLRKSEGALPKVPPDSWQSRMLQDNVRALRLAIRILEAPTAGAAPGDLPSALAALDALTSKATEYEGKFRPGTPQHSLQRNRLAALRVARQAVRDAMGRPEADR